MTQEVKQWIQPYQTKAQLIYQNQQNRRDTLLIRYSTATEYCGGDECGSQCEIQRAVLTSKRDSTLGITIEAKLNDLVAINYSPFSQPDSNSLYAGIYLRNKFVDKRPATAQVSYLINYPLGGESLTVIEASCVSANECKRLKMSSVLLSKERGLVAYTDQLNQRWTIVN
ncbi:hypothetical protein [Spirosoma flavum]|uniref:Uncharacterized protein n=1 Tax=Spirosoma flavum TaxID=2048557 RepID=A0ABW6AVZ4_9BACT